MWDSIKVFDTHPDPGDTPAAAVLAPLFEEDEGRVRLVLTKRPDTMPTHAGHIAFPGGRPDPADSGPVDTALREAQEEVGIDPGRVEVLGFLEPIDTVEFAPMVIPVVGRVFSPVTLLPDEREVDKVYTPLLSELADSERWWSIPWDSWEVWYYQLGSDTLWGATARMVRLLVGLDTPGPER